ncbi:hypothetical protein BDV41DRAFT_577215 [Aspergillus transmontanensis]|uniref:Thioredoxin domain-containing protein n=1 Tax=Aspergillus transmontanensis TaxID=1034304 RepID=A0A5N6VWU9_9EURO|nr:hypothetical protein BDV41DRAFT_577215 [Aspergillus transmontanensis]
MPCIPIEDPDQFQELIGRPELTIIHFFDGESGDPGPELGLLLNGNHPGGETTTFCADMSAIDIGRDLGQLPMTVLYRDGEEVDDAEAGDMGKFLELCERATEE